jgi:phage anti-repressor protein
MLIEIDIRTRPIVMFNILLYKKAFYTSNKQRLQQATSATSIIYNKSLTMEPLTIQEFIDQHNDNIDHLYVDKFWQSISDDKWIYIGDDMLKWMGYNYHDEFRHKITYLNILTTHFIQKHDFQHLTASEFKNSFLHSGVKIEMPNDFNQHNRAMHIIVSPDCFKESLMLMNTTRAKQIRKYYIQLEKIYKAYLEYCNDFKDLQLSAVNKELKEAKASTEQFKMMIAKKSEYKADQYIYIASSHNYAKQNIFKVGMTQRLERRMTGYQTGRVSDDKFMYLHIIKCVNGKALERMIFSRLEAFKHEDSKELFQIHFIILQKMLNEFESVEVSITNKFNSMMSEYYDTYTSMPIPHIKDIAIDDLDLYIEDRFDIKPIDRYVPAKDEAPHHKPLTDEQINERLLPHGIQLKEPYGGSCDQVDTFRCLSILDHTIKMSYSVLLRTVEQGCVHCRKIGILDHIPIYVYDETSYDLLRTYDSYNDLVVAEPNWDHGLFRDSIRKERWLQPYNNCIYSILSPHNGKFDLMKPLTDAEAYIISKLEIDFVSMRDRLMSSSFKFVIAIDEQSKKVYSGVSNMEFEKKLMQLKSSRSVKRKGIAKYLNKDELYGGYRWVRSATRMYNGQSTINISTLPDLA